MLSLEVYLTEKYVNRAMVSVHAGISQAKTSQMMSYGSTKLRADGL